MPGANQRHTDLRGLGMASPQQMTLYHSFVLGALSIFGEGSFFDITCIKSFGTGGKSSINVTEGAKLCLRWRDEPRLPKCADRVPYRRGAHDGRRASGAPRPGRRGTHSARPDRVDAVDCADECRHR